MKKKNKKSRGWPGEPVRHSLAGQGIQTVIDGDKRFDVSQFVARGVPEKSLEKTADHFLRSRREATYDDLKRNLTIDLQYIKASDRWRSTIRDEKTGTELTVKSHQDKEKAENNAEQTLIDFFDAYFMNTTPTEYKTYELVSLCKDQEGWSVAGQLEEVFEGRSFADMNPNALKYIHDFLKEKGERELAGEVDEYLTTIGGW